MRHLSFMLLVIGLSGYQFLSAQSKVPIAYAMSSDELSSMFMADCLFSVSPASSSAASALPAATLQSMSSEADLQMYHQRAEEQARNLASYSATTIIRAELPATSQSGEYRLRRDYLAPRTLEFRVTRSAGDAFVERNVIARLLQSEIDHVQKDDPALTALTSINYTFSYKSTATLNGREVRIYQVKPRFKRVGLFRGRIYLDARTANLVRAEGRIVKSPSVFIKSIEFVQNDFDVAGFTFPAHIHYKVRARFVGTAVVDIYDQDYQLNPVADHTIHQNNSELIEAAYRRDAR
jgi:hypothetical protein